MAMYDMGYFAWITYLEGECGLNLEEGKFRKPQGGGGGFHEQVAILQGCPIFSQCRYVLFT